MDNTAKDRVLLPRWRSMDRTVGAELASVSVQIPAAADKVKSNLLTLYAQWKEKSTLEAAWEVVNAAVATREPYLAYGPARQLLASLDVWPAARRLAKFIIDGPAEPNIGGADFNLPFEKTDAYSSFTRLKLADIKFRLREQPRNSLLWVERARIYAMLGEKEKADNAFHVALGIAGDARIILRPFARYMGQSEARAKEGLRRFRSAGSLKWDPWVQAAEISLAGIANRSPFCWGNAQDILRRRDIHPAHLSELRSALATKHLVEGDRKKLVRNLFIGSLDHPTENVVAQALWAKNERNLNITIDSTMLDLRLAYEARVQAAQARRDWLKAIENCKGWLADERFSVRAAISGSYLAANYLWDHSLAIAFCNEGLIANPGERTLLNNKAVSLCRMGKLDDARGVIAKIKPRSDGVVDPIHLATQGLLAFRMGNIEVGRKFYSRSVEILDKAPDGDARIRARYNWILEESEACSLSGSAIREVVESLDARVRKLRPHKFTIDSWDIFKLRILQRAELCNSGDINDEVTLLVDIRA